MNKLSKQVQEEAVRIIIAFTMPFLYLQHLLYYIGVKPRETSLEYKTAQTRPFVPLKEGGRTQ